MTRQIFKYPLRIKFGLQLVPMTPRADILHVGTQFDSTRHDNVICLWAVHDDELRDASRQFIVLGTGGEVPGRSSHIGTVQVGEFVWHIFELYP